LILKTTESWAIPGRKNRMTLH